MKQRKYSAKREKRKSPFFFSTSYFALVRSYSIAPGFRQSDTSSSTSPLQLVSPSPLPPSHHSQPSLHGRLHCSYNRPINCLHSLLLTITHMVLSLSFVHPKGANIAGRFWPHQGHLGLTPLVISGIIRVRAENESNHTASLPSSSLAAPSTSSSSSSTSSASFSSLNGNANGALRASQVIISLRCYEARLGRVGVVKTNVLYDLPISLWSATASPPSSKRGPQAMRGPTAATPDALPIADLPHTDFPFHISIPPSSAGGCSSCHLQSYRVYWRLEASEFARCSWLISI